MRIISGSLKGRMIHPPKDFTARPTTDFARTGLFNILQNEVAYESLNVLDLFCGSGTISFEFVSRGALAVSCVDENSSSIRSILDHAAKFGVDNLKAFRFDAFRFINQPGEKYNLIFADPPYDIPEMQELPDIILNSKRLYAGGLFILEHSRDYSFESHAAYYKHRDYSSVRFTFFKP